MRKNSPRPKTLIIVRHAHRDKAAGRERDNGLSAKGKRQTERLLTYFDSRYRDTRPYMVSSPKVRCVETLLPLAKKEKTELQISTLLLEQGSQETKKAMAKRVKRFCDWCRSPEAPELLVACSHGDWIPVCLEELTGVTVHLSKAGWAEIEWSRGQAELRWLLQEV